MILILIHWKKKSMGTKNKAFMLLAFLTVSCLVGWQGYLLNQKTDTSYLPAIAISQKQKKVNQQESKKKGIFKKFINSSSSVTQKRQNAAKDLQNFLRGIPIPDEQREILNHKLIQIGLKVDERSGVQLMSQQEWEEKFTQLSPEEIVPVRNKAAPMTTDALMVQVRQHFESPTIDIKFGEPLNEEDEEEEVRELNKSDSYNLKVQKRALLIKKYLYSSFSRTINHKRNEKRKTVVNEYIDNTIKHYQKKLD